MSRAISAGTTANSRRRARSFAGVARDAPLEFDLNREKAMCCGAGGARMWLEESIGTRINVTRVEQALPQAPQVIATACPYCAVMMGDGVSALGQDERDRRPRHRRAHRGRARARPRAGAAGAPAGAAPHGAGTP